MIKIDKNKPKDLSACFMRLEDIQKALPKFKPKQIFESISDQEDIMEEKYVKCEEIKSIVHEEVWKMIESDMFYDFFKAKTNSDIRLTYLGASTPSLIHK